MQSKSDEIANSSEQIMDASSLLAAMRKGQEHKFTLKYGNMKIECRPLTAMEEAQALQKAKANAREKAGKDTDLMTLKTFESVCIMQSVLFRATSINGAVGFTQIELNDMSSEELDYLYNQYISTCKVVDPEFEQLSDLEIKEMILAVKKKNKVVSDYFTWQLAEVGKFFLKEIVPILPEANELGS